MSRVFLLLLALTTAIGWPAPARAQTSNMPFRDCPKALRVLATGISSGGGKWLLVGSALGPVEIQCDDTQIFADEVEWSESEETVYARGKVLLVQPGLRVYADRAELHRTTRLGVFHGAVGTVRLTERQVEKSLFGTLEPEVMFYGERLEKVGPETYRLKSGGFTTCAQPTPRWEMTGSTGTITLDKRAVLRNAVLRVKNVPIVYVPVIYYPLGEDDRSTGFLLPTYSTSTVRGTGLSNAFFWALGRSHDATFYHDWFSKSGQGYGGEYRFISAPGSDGDARMYVLDERARLSADGLRVERPAHRSYDVRGGISQGLPGGFRLFGRVNYFSDASTKQLYEQNVFDFSRRERFVGATLSGNLGRTRLTAVVEQRDAYYGVASAERQGRAPSVTLALPDRTLGRSRIYFGVNGELAYLVREDDIFKPETDRSLWRFDGGTTLRVPLSRLSFLTATTSASWRVTHWLERIDPVTDQQINAGLTRQLLDLRANVVGPVFARIFTPRPNNYAERFKHLIEPAFGVRWLSPFDEIDSVVKLDGTDTIVGGTMELRYGLANRLLARRKAGAGPGAVREILSAEISQTYYTDARAALFDPLYLSSAASRYSPLQISIVGHPADAISGRFRMEIDAHHRAVRTLGASSTLNKPKFNLTAGWSKRQVIPGLPGFDSPATAFHFLNGSATVKLADNRFGGTYSFNLDIRNADWLQQRIVAYYNAQCCGITVDYQSIGGGFGALADRRFGISFTLAGIGSFSNPLGSFGDNSGRR